MSRHFEICCQLCGVSFAIAGLRRAHELEAAAWSLFRHDFTSVDDTILKTGGNLAGEHIIGHGYVQGLEYSGNRISLAEMKGCRDAQCLVKKSSGWRAEDDDQSFEVQGNFFLTGVGKPNGIVLDYIASARHGVDRTLIENVKSDRHPELSEYGLPFHPTCFEIYKKICKMRIGKIDTEGLYEWRNLDCDEETFFDTFPRDPAVRSGCELRWKHELGCEYLVANPMEIPGLFQKILNCSSIRNNRKKTKFGNPTQYDDSPTKDCRKQSSTSNAGKDPFSPLPTEISCMILDHLGSKDIANLRLATPVFRQLPSILFRRLIFEDMPWLFEVKDLDVARVDWYDCYCFSKLACGAMKGLRNRRRIWRDVEEIVRRIQNYRAEGKIAPLRAGVP